MKQLSAAERIDSLVTVYIGRESNEVVGSLIKGVSSYIKGVVDRFPGFKIEIEDGRIKLNSLAGSWDAIIHAALSRAYVCRPRWLRALR